jgi:hypothetical protein
MTGTPHVPDVENETAAGTTAEQARARDARGAAILGWFHLALAAPVLIGTIYAELPIDRLLDVGAAAVLTAVGTGLLLGSRRLARGARANDGR